MRISDWSSDVCSSDLLEGSWTHRNLLPPEGALTFRGVLGTLEQGVGATLRRSNAGRRDRTFELVTEVTRSTYDAFNAITGRVAARVSYDSTPIWQKNSDRTSTRLNSSP